MKITIATPDHAMQFMRRAGYGFQKEGGGETAFIRRVGGSDFPRYHAYVSEANSSQPQAASGDRVLAINLHVDQKAPTYGNGKAHSGEYDGPLIEQEAARLRGLVASQSPGTGDQEPRARKGFFGRLFS